MADNGVENNSGSQSVEKQIEQKVAAQSAEQLKAEMKKLEERVGEIKKSISDEVQTHGSYRHEFKGNKDDEGTERGRANSITEFIKKIFVAAKVAPEKVPAADKPAQSDPNAPILTPESTKLLQKLGESISTDSINDLTAPYFYDLVKSISNGEVKSAEDLKRALGKALPIQEISPIMFDKLKDASAKYAVSNFNTAEKEAKQMFGVSEIETNQEYSEDNQRRAMEELSAERDFRGNWEHIFSGHFNEGKEKVLIEALYSPVKFVKYYEKIQEDIRNNPKNKSLEEKAIAQEASKQMEVNVAFLFGKLYQKLDHESPKEFFQSIEQEDIMKGITPVKSELKRRIKLLATSLKTYQNEEEKAEKKVPVFFQRLEQDTETVAVEVESDKKNKSIKPRVRFKTTLVPTETSGSHFAHYLDQLVEHYIEARRYTHNARAVFLHPVDAQKGFYGQLAHFASESSQYDFDQMMLLPDSDIFQSAFGLYNKMIEEGFANHDWRHPAGMFTQKLNEHTTQIEGKILKQLKAMHEDVSEDRLTAALTMAVGASRGIFLTEPEMASHADPHLTEKGGSTFTSYYHQDATALMAFNPQHLLYRFHGSPTLLDPIFFMPVSGFKGSQAFHDHKQLWDKARKYKASFIDGRAPLNGEQTFFDKLDNIGLIGGPMQRKGWRTAWQLDSLYISDRTETIDSEGRVIKGPIKTNHMKTFKHFENIGYELLQDYVTKLTAGAKPDDDDDMGDGSFTSARNTFGANKETKALANQRKELFEYIFTKYFKEDPKNLGTYLDKIRTVQRDKLLKDIRTGNAAPKNIDNEIEGMTSNEFLDRMLARVILQRVPSKIIRMDRDRLSQNGTSRYKQIMKDMGLEGQFDQFGIITQDMILVEQMMRKDVSSKMRAMQGSLKPGDEWKYADIKYEITAESIRATLEPLIARGDKIMDQKRLDNVLRLYGHIQTRYLKDDAFINKELVPYFKRGGAIERTSKYTIALDETDLSFIPFRAGGESVLARSLRDIANVEKNVSGPITEFVSKLRAMAIDGKKDFGPIIEIISKAWGALDGIIGFPYANELASNIAQMTIMYMKKDTQARALMGVGGIGRFNSMAAEGAHKKLGVWEWDSADIDRFITALEARNLVPGTPYNVGAEPKKEPRYVNVPFKKEPIKLPEKIATSKIAELLGGKDGKFTIFGKEIPIPDIPLFWRRKHDHHVWSKSLREKFGGTKFDMFFDIVNKYLPFVVIMILWQLIKKAFEDSEPKKK